MDHRNSPSKAATPPPPRGCELLSQNIFDDVSYDSAEEGGDELLKRREPTMQRRGKTLVAPMSQDAATRYTVVFDLDETVVYGRDGPLYGRAYLRDLLSALKGNFEVIVWTAGDREYAKNVLGEINYDHVVEHLIYRHRKWFTEEDYTKDLSQLGRDLNYTIIIENTPDCVRNNPENGIIVDDFEVPAATAATQDEDGGSAEGESPSAQQTPKRKHVATDRTLLLLREVLEGLAKSGETVPAFLSKCDLLSRQVVTGSDGEDIPIYFLGPRRRRRDAGVPRKVVKTNRDKGQLLGDDEEEEEADNGAAKCSEAADSESVERSPSTRESTPPSPTRKTRRSESSEQSSPKHRRKEEDE